MCLNTINRFPDAESAEAGRKLWRTANKDIIVYKLLLKKKARNGTFKYISPFKEFQYKKGEHYYQTDDWCTATVVSVGSMGFYLEINEGLHSYLNPFFASTWYNNSVLVKMVIPKGSRYFMGQNGDIVSDNLIWK